jgi:DNA-binding transcriptional MerR regulator
MMAAGEMTCGEIAKSLGVNEDTLRRWKREEEPQPPKNITPAVYIKNYRWFNTKW